MNTAKDKRCLTVLLGSKRQKDNIDLIYGADRVILNWDMEIGRDEISRIKGSFKEVMMALPHLVRKAHIPHLKALLDKSLKDGIQGFLIRNMESLELLRDAECIKISDHNMYAFNTYSVSFLKEQGIDLITAPLELNKHEIKDLGERDLELMVYGYIPLMTTVQNAGDAFDDKEPDRETYIRDRQGQPFKVEAFRDYCYNIIYNSRPLYLLDKAEDISYADPLSLRVEFTSESRNDIKKIMDASKAFFEGEYLPYFGEDFTRGHFLRGVE